MASHLQIDADSDPDPAYDLDADPDPAYHFDADPDPAFQFDPDCGSMWIRLRIHNTAVMSIKLEKKTSPYLSQGRGKYWDPSKFSK